VRQVSGLLVTVLMGVAACQGETVAPAVHRTESSVSAGASSKAVPLDLHILVDQFGYRPADPKIAVIRDPKVGFDAADSFSPGTAYQLRRAGDGGVVYSGTLQAWNQGAVDSSAGDRGWWFDFSSVTAPGTYFVYDVSKNLRSPTFSIAQQVYQDVLKAAVRMYFYQRAGIAKATRFANSCWVDDAAYVGSAQDSQAHDITDPENPAKVRDLSGGWFDAGDTNKYVTNAIKAVHQLLTAYQEHPSVFTDDFNIPESGNGIPDLLDEVKWETDWLKKMQYPDGSVALKVGDTVYSNASPPSSDTHPRFYVPACTSSTIAAAGMFAHASYVFATVSPLQAEAADLKSRAINAWNNYQGVPAKQDKCDSGAVKVGGSDLSLEAQNTEAVVAAVYLYAITGDSSYASYIGGHYTLLRPYNDDGWIRYGSDQGEALLFYTTLSSADAALKQTILASKLKDTLAGNRIYGVSANDDLYRNFLGDYIWGSNEVRANHGNTNAEVATYGIAVSDAGPYQTRALDTLHYFHGVNPFGKVYLSNMYPYGATSSVNELFGGWFIAGSAWSDALTSKCGPAPGYVTGGPNARAGDGGVPANESPPVGQPAQKSYKDWNGQDHSWVVNEPSIYYQSAYVQLLAAFAK
jgi:endoglucanase